MSAFIETDYSEIMHDRLSCESHVLDVTSGFQKSEIFAEGDLSDHVPGGYRDSIL